MNCVYYSANTKYLALMWFLYIYHALISFKEKKRKLVRSNIKSSQYFILDFQNKLSIPRGDRYEQQLPSPHFARSSSHCRPWPGTHPSDFPVLTRSSHGHPFSTTRLLTAESAQSWAHAALNRHRTIYKISSSACFRFG